MKWAKRESKINNNSVGNRITGLSTSVITDEKSVFSRYSVEIRATRKNIVLI